MTDAQHRKRKPEHHPGVQPDFAGKLDEGSSKAMIAAGHQGGTKFGDAAGKATGGKFKSHMKSAAKLAAVGFAAAGAAAIKFGDDAIEEAREAQKVGKLTEAVIKSTSKAAKVTARDVGNLAGKLSDEAGIDDELIQSGANVLLTFTNIRNEVGEETRSSTAPRSPR